MPASDPFRLDGKIAVVTGASRGIGRAVAESFAAAGCAGLVLNARKADDLETAASGLRAAGIAVETVAGSMGEPDTAAAIVESAHHAFGRIDIIVNNAAANPAFGNLVDADPGAVRKIFAVNVEGPLALVRAAWHAGMGERGGAIVNMASVGGLEPMPFIGAYNTSKAALVHLTKQLALECAPTVRVNALAPGLVRTQFARALWEPDEDAATALIPLGRIGEPLDVAHAVQYLASDAAGWVTGAVLSVDGGQRWR